MRRLLGLRDFVHDAIEKTTDLVQETHEAATRKPLALLSLLEPLGAAARVAEAPHSLIAKAVYDGIRATNRTVQAVSDEVVALVRTVVPDDLELSNESPLGRTVNAWTDWAESALNAFAGDFLEARDNGLSIKLCLRHESSDLELTREALAASLPEATGKVCIFVHGLACSDSIWREQHAETQEEVSFGRKLREEHGYTPLYVRYNTGLHISQNGRSLSSLLDQLLANYPIEIERIALVGHSMGGLVSRSAAHYGKALDQAWIGKLKHVLCIGSPHFGAPLERASNAVASVLGFFDVAGTQVPAKLLNARSAGIKDLRYGSVLDDDWLDASPDSFFTDTSKHAPFVEGVSYGYVAAHYAPLGASAMGQMLGDLLVQLPSASGKHQDETRHLPFHMGHVLEGVHHIALTRHPSVYPQLVRFLTEITQDAPAGERTGADASVDAQPSCDPQ
jgi:triacylglycerol lipase